MLLDWETLNHMFHATSEDFLSRLAAAQAYLSPKMAHFAAFLGDNYVNAAFMSTRELAAAAGVSLATVVRFPRVLGYADFEALRVGIQDRLNFDLTGVERLRNLPATSRSPSALLRRIIDADIESLRALAHSFSEPQMERFVAGLIAAERVTVVGFRYVRPLTAYFEYSLAKVKSNVVAFTRADSSLFDHVRLMGPNDVLVAITFARYPAELVGLVRYAHSRGVRVLAITDSPLSPVLPLAETALFAKASMVDFVGSLAAPAALISCVVSEVGVRLGQRVLDRLQALEEAAAAANIYVRAGSQPNPHAGLLAWPDDPTPKKARRRGRSSP